MPFPLAELTYSGTYAIIITLNNHLRIHRVKPIYGRLFFVKDLGIFQLDEDYRYILGRSEVYFFAQKGTNPISIAAFLDWQNYCRRNNKRTLTFEDLAKHVDKIRKVEQRKRLIVELRKGNSQENMPPIDPKDLQQMEFEGTLDFQAELMSLKSTPTKKDLEVAGIEEKSNIWLNGYFKEDTVSRFYLNLRQITDDKFKLPESPLVRNYLLLQSTTNKQNIAFVIINNTIIEIDAQAKLIMNPEKGHYELITRKYGVFQNIDPQTRYMYGRQRIFIVMVNTSIKPFDMPEKDPADATAQPAPTPDNGNGNGKTLHRDPELEGIVKAVPALKTQITIPTRGRRKAQQGQELPQIDQAGTT